MNAVSMKRAQGRVSKELVECITEADVAVGLARAHLARTLRLYPEHKRVVAKYGFIFEQYMPHAWYQALIKLGQI